MSIARSGRRGCAACANNSPETKNWRSQLFTRSRINELAKSKHFGEDAYKEDDECEYNEKNKPIRVLVKRIDRIWF
jgi:hypothetical protein